MTDTQKEITDTYKGLAAGLAKGRRLAAVKLFCIECHGGNGREAKACEQRSCFLWPVRGNWTRDAK